MAKGIRNCVAKVGARMILVTSAQPGDGKTMLLETLRDEFRAMEMGHIAFLGLGTLKKMAPSDFDEYELVVIEGPSPGGDHLVLNLSRAWMQALDGAILIVMKRHTTRSALADMHEWVKVAGLRTLGVVWNEREAPPPRLRLLRWQNRFTALFGRKSHG